MYTVKNLFEDEAKNRGFIGNRYNCSQASLAIYEDQRNKKRSPCIMMAVSMLEMDKEVGFERYQHLMKIIWGVDSALYGRTGFRGNFDLKDFTFPFTIEEGLATMGMEASRDVEEARKNGGWIKNPEDRKKIMNR